MDIHKPKSWHGPREFLKEIGTIVIGVLIALAGEQAVEALHWRHQAHTGEAQLKIAFLREIDNVAQRSAQDACVTRRLAELSTILRQGADTGRLAPVGPIGHPSFQPWTVGAWPVLVADQTVSHLPRREAITYTRIVQNTVYLSGLSDREEDQWTVLDSLVGQGRRLSDVEAQQLRTTLAMAAAASVHMTVTSGMLREAIRESGLLAPSDFTDAERRAKAAAARADICRPLSRP